MKLTNYEIQSSVPNFWLIDIFVCERESPWVRESGIDREKLNICMYMPAQDAFVDYDGTWSAQVNLIPSSPSLCDGRQTMLADCPSKCAASPFASEYSSPALSLLKFLIHFPIFSNINWHLDYWSFRIRLVLVEMPTCLSWTEMGKRLLVAGGQLVLYMSSNCPEDYTWIWTCLHHPMYLD